VGRFGPGLWAVLVHGPFWSFPFITYSTQQKSHKKQIKYYLTTSYNLTDTLQT